MKSIYLLRHGHAASPRDLDDHDRPLGDRGREETRPVGVWMAERGMVPDLVLVSSAVRAQETFGIWREGAIWEGRSETDSTLYLASAGCICERLTSLGEETQRVLIIGHNPGLSGVLRTLADRTQMMDTSTLAHLSMGDDPWSQALESGGCRWEGCWSPRDLAGLS